MALTAALAGLAAVVLSSRFAPVERALATVWLDKFKLRAIATPGRAELGRLALELTAVESGCDAGLFDKIVKVWPDTREPAALVTVESLTRARVVYARRFKASDISLPLRAEVRLAPSAAARGELLGVFVCGDRLKTGSCFGKDPLAGDPAASTEFDRIWHFTPLFASGAVVATGEGDFPQRIWPWVLADDPFERRVEHIAQLSRTRWQTSAKVANGRVSVTVPRTSISCYLPGTGTEPSGKRKSKSR